MPRVFRQKGAVHNRIKQIGVPTLILWGEKDTWIPLENAHRFMREIPGAVLVTYPNLGHVPMEEAPDRTAADAAAFLKRVSRNP